MRCGAAGQAGIERPAGRGRSGYASPSPALRRRSRGPTAPGAVRRGRASAPGTSGRKTMTGRSSWFRPSVLTQMIPASPRSIWRSPITVLSAVSVSPGKDRHAKAQFGKPEIGDHVVADVGHALAQHHMEGASVPPPARAPGRRRGRSCRRLVRGVAATGQGAVGPARSALGHRARHRVPEPLAEVKTSYESAARAGPFSQAGCRSWWGTVRHANAGVKHRSAPSIRFIGIFAGFPERPYSLGSGRCRRRPSLRRRADTPRPRSDPMIRLPRSAVSAVAAPVIAAAVLAWARFWRPTRFAARIECPIGALDTRAQPPVDVDHIFCGEINARNRAVGFQFPPGWGEPRHGQRDRGRHRGRAVPPARMRSATSRSRSTAPAGPSRSRPCIPTIAAMTTYWRRSGHAYDNRVSASGQPLFRPVRPDLHGPEWRRVRHPGLHRLRRWRPLHHHCVPAVTVRARSPWTPAGCGKLTGATAARRHTPGPEDWYDRPGDRIHRATIAAGRPRRHGPKGCRRSASRNGCWREFLTVEVGRTTQGVDHVVARVDAAVAQAGAVGGQRQRARLRHRCRRHPAFRPVARAAVRSGRSRSMPCARGGAALAAWAPSSLRPADGTRNRLPVRAGAGLAGAFHYPA